MMVFLPIGEYRLLVCGTTSITDLAGNALNGGVDSVMNLVIDDLMGDGSVSPETGFSKG